MGFKSGIFLSLVLLFCHVSSDEILGCGGFIKSDVEINYSLIEVKLYTKQGSLKYQTDCAPNNGYYMLPVYNKGEYVIKVDAPSGWTFEPMSYSITIDGKTDRCTLSEDINFLFTGFGVVGKVLSKGQDHGPAGVTLVLRSTKDGEVVRKTTSMIGGKYTFEKILPGDYVVEATHHTWMFESATGVVSLTKETGMVTDTIIVSGFDVKGKIMSDGEAVSGVNFFLFGSGDVQLVGCSNDPLHAPVLEGHTLLCSTVSDGRGLFEFPAVQTGSYVLVPFYTGEKIKYDVTPGRVDVNVNQDSFVIKEPFQVAGFVVSGKVKACAKGQGVSGAQVFVNGSPVTKTDDDGVYHLEAMKTGVYQLKAEAPRMQFNSLEVKVTPNTPHLPVMIASRFEVCGNIMVNETYKIFSSGSRDVVFHHENGEVYAKVVTKEGGSFCIFAAPGSYKCSAKISDEERKAGFRLLPFENVVQVLDSPVDGITFSQFHAKLTGTIQCLENCGSMQLVLQSSTKSEEAKVLEVSSESNTLEFQFDNIMAGSYELTIQNEKWCWKEKTTQVNVVDKDITDLNFVHSGYMVVTSLSHDAHLTFEPVFNPPSTDKLLFELSRGINKFCLKEAGGYVVNVQSCHLFEEDSYKYDTSLGGVLSLVAVQHKIEVSVTTTSKHDDIMAHISSKDGDKKDVGPLVLSKTSADGKTFEYSTQHWARTSESLSVTLTSGVLLFDPQVVHVPVKSDSCPSGKAFFIGRQGAFIEGGVAPALEGVDVMVSLNNGKVLYASTNDKGTYRIGPIDASLKYETSVSKSGYAFKSMVERPGFFKASKLAEIIVKVIEDSTGVELPGVLLSLSGGESFRRNNVTQENESLVFTNLGPGQYFVKPMMKEYEFEPSSKFVEVNEGATVHVDVVAKRVAFSCYGQVISLNGEAEVGVHLEAVSDDDDAQCKDHQEESKTGLDGSIRIRGLKPGCSYILKMKNDKDLNAVIERTSPKQIKLKVKNADIHDVKMVAFRRINTMDISGRVVAPQEHLASIKVHLVQESNADAPQHTTNLGPSPFFYFSSIPINNQSYVLKLSSSLSRSHFNYSLPELQFKADSPFKHFTLQFDPQFKVGDQELAHSSLLVLPLTLLVLYICYNRKQVLPFLSQHICVFVSMFAAKVQTSRSSPVPQAPVDSGFSAEFLASEPPSKKKLKAKKI